MQIEAGVPIPSYTRPSKHRFPLGDMEIGDSFFVEWGRGDQAKFLATARSLISRFGRVYGMRFATRIQEGGFRVWRID
jgi:hypothetical protein